MCLTLVSLYLQEPSLATSPAVLLGGVPKPLPRSWFKPSSPDHTVKPGHFPNLAEWPDLAQLVLPVSPSRPA